MRETLVTAPFEVIPAAGDSAPRPGRSRLPRWPVRVFPPVFLAAAGFACVFLVNRTVLPSVLQFVAAAGLGLVAGFGSRLALPGRTALARGLVALAGLTLGLLLLGVITWGHAGLGPFGLSSAGPDWRGLGQLAAAASAAWLTLRAWQPRAAEPAAPPGPSVDRPAKRSPAWSRGFSRTQPQAAEPAGSPGPSVDRPANRSTAWSRGSAKRPRGVSRTRLKARLQESYMHLESALGQGALLQRPLAWIQAVRLRASGRWQAPDLRRRADWLRRQLSLLAARASQAVRRTAVRLRPARPVAHPVQIRPPAAPPQPEARSWRGELRAGWSALTRRVALEAGAIRSGRRSWPPLRVPQSPRRPNRSRRAAIRLIGKADDFCPYCLERVEPNDSRGVVTCPVCHTRHHADCWAVTGACQVPHQHE